MAAVERERDLGALREASPRSRGSRERASGGRGRRRGRAAREAVALEVEGEGLEDERGGVARVEGDGAVGLGDAARASGPVALVPPRRRARARSWAPCAKWRRDWRRRRRRSGGGGAAEAVGGAAGREWRATSMAAARMKRRHWTMASGQVAAAPRARAAMALARGRTGD